MTKIFQFTDITTADLVVDAVYQGGRKGHSGDDPIGRTIPGAGNQGGFRLVGNWSEPNIAVIYSSLDDPDWPDSLDVYTGVFTYFGDNKKPGFALHDTPRCGNRQLQRCFDIVHNAPADRVKVPPFLIFTKAGEYRDVIFRGIAVPGVEGGAVDDLAAIWRSKKGQRFQNYRAMFTVLDCQLVPRAWISDLRQGNPMTANAPPAWLKWVRTGKCDALRAVPTLEHRSKEQQAAAVDRDRALVARIYENFKDDPHGFEHCAAAIAAMMDRNINIDIITRPSRDGGRDAIGTYRIGPASDRITLDFALEAKCYAPGNGVGVKEVARVISRLRYRQFGIIVTTSHISEQAYAELRQDGHPVIVIAGADIATILVSAGITTPESVTMWLESAFGGKAQQ